jgi:multiple sugar transport system substrate-binding protein
MFSDTYNPSRRNVVKMGLGGLAGLSAFELASCNDTPPTTSVATKTAVKMQLLFWGTTTRNKLTTKAISLFEQQHTDIAITSSYAAFGDYWPKLDALVASGHTPALFQMDMQYLSLYVREQLMYDLTQLIYNQTIELSDFDPLLLDGSKANNALYGIPLGGNYQCLLYDSALVDKSGVGDLPAKITWDVFAQYTRELSHALGPGIYGVTDSSGDASVYEIWVRQRGKELYNADGTLAFDVQDVEDWFNYWSILRNSGACVTPAMQVAFAAKGGASNSPVIHGQSVFGIPHSNELESYQALTSHTIMLYPIPDGPGPGLYFKPSMLISIAANTPYVLEAAAFIDFIINDPGGITAFGIERGIPGVAKAQALLNPTLTAVQQREIAFTNATSQSGSIRIKEVLSPPKAGKVAALFTQASTDVSVKHVSISDSAKAFITNAKKILAV